MNKKYKSHNRNSIAFNSKIINTDFLCVRRVDGCTTLHSRTSLETNYVLKPVRATFSYNHCTILLTSLLVYAGLFKNKICLEICLENLHARLVSTVISTGPQHQYQLMVNYTYCMQLIKCIRLYNSATLHMKKVSYCPFFKYHTLYSV